MKQAVNIINSIISHLNQHEDVKESDQPNIYKHNGITKYNINTELFDFIDDCITEDRYTTIIFKVMNTELNIKNVTKAIGIMTGNVFQELSKSKSNQLNLLDKNQKQILKKYAHSCVQAFFNPKIASLENDLKKAEWMNDIWCKYSSIENSSKVLINRLHDYGVTDEKTQWAVTEKVHGANFAIVYNGKEFGAAKRTCVLNEHSMFYPGWQDVVENEKDHIKNAYNLLKKMDDQINMVVVYGELFGGLYSHTDEKYMAKPGVKHVQKRMYYSPQLHFYAFDIRTNFTDIMKKNNNKRKKTSEKLEFGVTLDILKQSGFLYCEPIMIGSFNECVGFDVETFQTTIPSKLGLPPAINPKDGSLIVNIAEGIVLRKLCGRHQSIKIKSSAFYEVTGHQLPGTNSKPKKKSKFKVENINKENIKNDGMGKYKLSEMLFNFIERCVNENRYDAVLSKVGILSLKNVRKVMGMMVGDIYQELNQQQFDEMSALNKDAKTLVKKYINACVSEFFAAKLLQLDNE